MRPKLTRYSTIVALTSSGVGLDRRALEPAEKTGADEIHGLGDEQALRGVERAAAGEFDVLVGEVEDPRQEHGRPAGEVVLMLPTVLGL